MKRSLSFLSPIYRTIVSIRNEMYDRGLLSSFRISLPVFCVGNVTAGGSGKTPLVQMLVQYLVEAGARPAVLLRGYGGTESGPMMVTETTSWNEVGDEAVLHYHH